MKLIIGLGNPGLDYSKTRHNLGFRALNELISRISTDKFGIWKEEKKFQALIAESVLNKEKILLAKPLCFMNNSGQTVKKIADYFKIPCHDILVVHDDIDLPLGEVRLQKSRGSAGHKGVQSIIDHLKTKDFLRVRIGIAPENKEQINAEDYVLQNFTLQELESVKIAIKKAAELITETF